MAWKHGLAATLTLSLTATGCGSKPHVGKLAELGRPEARSGVAAAPQTPGATGTSPIADRLLSPNDLLEVTVYEAPEMNRTVRVSQSGDISLPLMGAHRAAGKTLRELRASVQDQLRRFVRDPHVTIEIKEFGTSPIYIVGEVNEPGAFVPAGTEGLTVLRAVALAKGLTPEARKRSVVIRMLPNGSRQQITLDLNDVIAGKLVDLPLLPNDVVYVPKNTEKSVVLGAVDMLVRVVTFRAVF